MLSSLLIVAFIYFLCVKFIFLPRSKNGNFNLYLSRTIFNSKLVGISVFFVSLPLLSLILGPNVCSDGWISPSIGLPGACSHHGGVDMTKRILSFAAATILGIVSCGKVREIKKGKGNIHT